VISVLAYIVNWFATLFMARSPDGLHNFLAAFLRYSTHIRAYLLLVADPFPPFTGRAGTYPIDLEIDGPERQNRWLTAFRLVLMVPAVLLALAFVGGFGGGVETGDHGDRRGGGGTAVAGVLWTVAFLAWFASLVTGRMPRGFRDLQAYGLRFLAQASAYGFVLTDRYPSVDPAEPRATGPAHPVRLAVDDDLRRSRLTVLFRLLLALPHFVWLALWTVAAILAAVVAWVVALVAGRVPEGLHRFLAAFVRYEYHVFAYVALTANPFPGFTGTPGRFPVDPLLPPRERQRRLVTGFRLLLAVPALVVSNGLGLLLFVCAFLGWFAVLATGRMPRSLREAQAYALRYGVQASAYLLLLTARYPYSGPALGEPPPEPAAPEAAAQV
jgi:hypothetical protein